MAIIAKASTSTGESFIPAPVGMHRAIAVDVVDMGLVTGKYGEKHLVRVIWQTEALMPDGKPYLIDRRYTLSLDERATLRRDLEAWRRKPFTLAEAAGFDLERLIGVPCTLLVVHKPGKTDDKVFANVQAVLPAMPGAPLVIRDYVRVILRTAPANGKPAAAPTPIGPSYAPPPTAYVPPGMAATVAAPAFDADPFGGDAHDDGMPLTDDQIPFSALLPLVLPLLGGLLA